MDGALREQAPAPPTDQASPASPAAHDAATKSRLEEEIRAGKAAWRERYARARRQASPDIEARFEEQIEEVVRAADDSSVRWKEPEGRFILALLGSMRMLTEVVVDAEGSFSATAAQARTIAEAELQKVREVVVAIDGVKVQARAAIEVSKAEQDRALRRMVADYLPQFLEGIREVAVIRERSWNRKRAQVGLGVAGGLFVAVFLAGFGLCLWVQWSETALGARCLHSMFSSQGKTYCQVDSGTSSPTGSTEQRKP